MFLHSEFDIFDGLVRMDLRRFITLKTVVEEGSFLRAPQKLCCTQLAVTFHIQQIERELSVQLFGEIGHRIYLTSEGKRLMPHIHSLTRAVALIRQSAHQDAQPSGDLRVATGETLLACKTPQVLQRFEQHAPYVRPSLQLLNCYVIRDALLSDGVGLGVFYRVGNDDVLELMPLGDQSPALVAPSLFQHVDSIQHNQHIPCSFIISEPQCIFGQRFEGLLREQQITLGSTTELWNIESIEQCVLANLRISFLSHFTVEKELRSGELIKLPFGGQPELTTTLCSCRAGKVVSPAMWVFLECIGESFASRGKIPG